MVTTFSIANVSGPKFKIYLNSHLQGRHFLLLLCQFVNHMEVTRLPVYVPSQEEKDDPKLYANNVRRLMAKEVLLSSLLCYIHLEE